MAAAGFITAGIILLFLGNAIVSVSAYPKALSFLYCATEESLEDSTEEYMYPQECCPGYKMNSVDDRQCDPVCEPECESAYCSKPNYCTCYRGHERVSNTTCAVSCPNCEHGYCNFANTCICEANYERRNDTCHPVCNNCINGFCTEDFKCRCHPGYVLKDNTTESQECVPHCDHAENCECVSPNMCECNPEYKHNPITKKCDPICENCRFGQCTSPGNCECNDRFQRINDTCEPVCVPACTNGKCRYLEIRTSTVQFYTYCVCNDGYGKSGISRNCDLPICNTLCTGKNSYCSAPDVCSCDKGYRMNNVTAICEPVCDGNCENGRCIAPGDCQCNKGYYNNDEGGCESMCTSTCKDDGTCVIPRNCTCSPGYLKTDFGDDGTEAQCAPICNPECKNGVCVAPNVCDCDEGYEIDENLFCMPECYPSCENGVCTKPNTCECYTGYLPDEEDVMSCLPVCSTDCGVHGHCLHPDQCECFDGYEFESSGGCVPQCDSPCVNGNCIHPNYCECFEDFRQQNATYCTPRCYYSPEIADCLYSSRDKCHIHLTVDEIIGCDLDCRGCNTTSATSGNCSIYCSQDYNIPNIRRMTLSNSHSNDSKESHVVTILFGVFLVIAFGVGGFVFYKGPYRRYKMTRRRILSEDESTGIMISTPNNDDD